MSDGFVPLKDMSVSAQMSFRHLHPELIENTPAQKQISPQEIKEKLNQYYWQIVSILDKYIDMPEENRKFVALWTVATYFHESFNSFPYLFFNAMRGSGKTRTLKLLSTLGSKGDGSVQNNLTEAVLFRIPRGTTTCIDEVEQIGNKEKQTLRELLNSAYKKGMKVKRMKKVKSAGEEKQIAEVFEPYFPICMANINGVEEVLADRSIVLVLEKSNNHAKTKLVEDFDTNLEIQDLKMKLTELCAVCVVSLRKKNYIQSWNNYICDKYNDTNIIYHTNNTNDTQQHLTVEDIEMEQFFNKIDDLGIAGRNFELLLPLLLTAKEISDVVFEEALTIGATIINAKKEEEYQDTKDVSLYEFCCSDLVKDRGLAFIPLKQLTSQFRLWLGESDNEDQWLNDKWMGRALKRLNLILSKKREASGRLVIINVIKAQDKLKMFKKD